MMKRLAELRLNTPWEPHFNEQLHLRTDLHLARKAWHMGMGMVVVAVYLLFDLSRASAIGILGSVLAMNLIVEVTRLHNPSFNARILRVWGPLMRSCEKDRLSGTPYYLSAMILAIAVFPQTIAVLSILYLAVGDPIASIFGVMYGDRSMRFANGKSLIGSAAGTLACVLVTFFFLSSYPISGLQLAALMWVGGFAGGLAELLPLEVDDNFSIPVVSGLVLWMAFVVLGV